MSRFSAVFFIGFFLVTSPLFAKDSGEPITVKAEIDNAFITIGDPVQYSVTIKSLDSVQLLTSIPVPPSDIFKVKKTEDIHKKEDGKKVTGKRFTLTTFKLGEFVIEPVSIQYRVGGGEVKTITTNSLYVTVKSVAEGEEKTDIRGIKTVVPFLISLWPWFLAATLIILAAAAVLIFNATRKVSSMVQEAQKLSPEDETLIELSQLYDSDLLRRSKIKEYHFRLSEILRNYIEKRFSILAIESTTYEIRNALRSTDVPGPLREKIITVLEAADLAKFAKWDPGAIKIKEMYNESRQIVEEARPRESAVNAV